MQARAGGWYMCFAALSWPISFLRKSNEGKRLQRIQPATTLICTSLRGPTRSLLFSLFDPHSSAVGTSYVRVLFLFSNEKKLCLKGRTGAILSFFFFQYQGLNLGLPACKAGVLLLKTFP
jgi:hypothetical protein